MKGFRVCGSTTSKILALLFTFFVFLSPAYAADPCSNDPNNDLYKKFGPCPSGLDQIESVFSNVVSVMVGLGFIALLVVVIMAGFKYLKSGGEPKALQSTHQTFTWAILGILFMIIAWLTLVLIENFTGLPVTRFNIKSLF